MIRQRHLVGCGCCGDCPPGVSQGTAGLPSWVPHGLYLWAGCFDVPDDPRFLGDATLTLSGFPLFDGTPDDVDVNGSWACRLTELSRFGVVYRGTDPDRRLIVALYMVGSNVGQDWVRVSIGAGVQSVVYFRPASSCGAFEKLGGSSGPSGTVSVTFPWGG